MIRLQAHEGHLLTDGEIYSETVYLAVTASPDDWKEIAQEEYEEK